MADASISKNLDANAAEAQKTDKLEKSFKNRLTNSEFHV